MKRTPPALALYTVVGTLLGAASAPAAISLTSLNTFDSSAEGWVEGGVSPNAPERTTEVGRDGITPGHLLNESDGGGAGGRQLMWNDGPAWSGDYLAANVTAIEMWADSRSNSGPALNLRVAFDGAGGWFVSNPLTVINALAGQAEWTRLTYSLDPGNFTYAGGGGTGLFADTMSGVTRFEILSASGLPGYAGSGDLLRGDNIVSDLRIDDIRAVPEPGSMALLGSAILAGCLFGRNRRASVR